MTMRAVENAKSYKWGEWLIGLMRAFISGGAAAFVTGGGGAVLGIPGKQIWELMGINFLLMGLYRLGEFLTLHGAPDPVALQVALDQAATSTAKAADAISTAKAVAPPAEEN